MPKNLLAFVDTSTDFSFCMRLRHGLNAKGFRLVLLTPKPSIVFKAYLRRARCILVKNSNNTTADIHVNSTTEVLSKEIGERDAAVYYNGVMELLENLHNVEGISVMLIRNGNSVPTKAMSLFAQDHNVATLYYEPSNIKRRLFIDPRGIDAQSLLFQKPEVLNRFPVDERQYTMWRDLYLKQRAKDQTNILDPGRGKYRKVISPIDSVGALFIDIPTMKSNASSEAAVENSLFDAYDADNGIYNYFPMQASNDSRLIFNSSVSLQDAVSIAYDKSREQQRDLLIQPHPRENKKAIIEYLSSMHGKEGLFIVRGSTFRFVERCKELITVNSVLGADALLAGKKVTFLGASFLAQMNEEQLKRFLLGYLIEVDYFSNESIPVKQVESMLSRLLLQ